MPKFKVSTKGFFEAKKDLEKTMRKLVDKATANNIGRTTVREMKKGIAQGRSPIKGKKRFPAYKKSYERVIKSGRFGGKRRRPVNLKLKGDFLDALIHKVINRGGQSGVEVGYFKKSEAVKEEGHRKGANRQKKRPTIPQGSEEFTVSIQRKVLDIIRERLKKFR